MAELAQLNLLDELYLHLDRPEEPWSVHVEAVVEGSLDEAGLVAAVRAAAARHPIARAALAPHRPTDVRYWWDVADELDEVSLAVVDCPDEAGVAAAREDALNVSPDLSSPPPFTLALLRHPDGDHLVLNLRHAAGDGLSAARLMGSILREYAGEDDPVAPVDPLEVRDVRRLVAASIPERVARARALVEHLARWTTTPVRVAADGGSDRPGYGFELLALDREAAAALAAHRSDGATVNDVLLAALAVAIRRWNDEHDAGTGRIALTMPVNLRPAEWRHDVVANYASYVTVHVAEEEQEDIDVAVAAVAARTRELKDRGAAGLVVDLLNAPTILPTGVKRQLQWLIPLTGDVVLDTAMLSNLGRLPPLPHPADAGAVRQAWFSPPGRMPLGTSFGVATLGEKMFITLRYRHALLDAAAARRLAAGYRAALLG